MNIHLGFWIVRGVISVIVLIVLIGILVKDDIGPVPLCPQCAAKVVGTLADLLAEMIQQ
jgi:hypothetical protein